MKKQSGASPADLETGFRYHRAGRFADARRCYEAVLRAEPGNGRALALSGALALQVGEPERAAEHLGRAVEANPGDAGSWNNLGAALAQAGRPAEAMDAYRRAIELDPNQSDAWHNLGNLLLAGGRYRESIAAYERALSLNSDDPGCRRSLGSALRAAGDPWGACRELEIAAEALPDEVSAWMELAAARDASGDTAGAERAWRRAIELAPGETEARLGLADALRRQERHDDAVHVLDQAGRDFRTLLAKGNVLLAAGRPADAAEAFGKALEQAPGDSSARLNLGIARLKQGVPGDAGQIFAGLRNDHPAPANVRYYQGLAALIGGDPERGLAHFDEALTFDPLHVNSLWYRGHCLRELGRNDEARGIVDPVGAFHLGDPWAARADAEKSVQLDELARYLAGYPFRTWEPAGKTTRGGFQTASLPVHDDFMRRVRRLIEEEVARFRRELPAEHALRRHWPERWTLDAWGTILHRGGHQMPHIHPGGFVSGVFYVELPPPGSGGAEAGWLELGGLPYEVSASYQPWTERVEPTPGRMVLFPSWMPHSTVPFDAEQRRVSLAFDLIPVN